MQASATPFQRRYNLAVEGFKSCYGIQEGATEDERFWGLKASEEDALYAVAHAAYPAKITDFGMIRTGEWSYRLEVLCADYYEFVCSDAPDEWAAVGWLLPRLDAILCPENLVAAVEEFGIEVNHDVYDADILAMNFSDFLNMVPAHQRDAAVAWLNDGNDLGSFGV